MSLTAFEHATLLSPRGAGLFVADEFVSGEFRERFFYILPRFFRRDFVLGNDIVGDGRGRETLVESFPNQHRGFIQLVVLLRVQIDEDALDAVEVGEDDVLLWSWIHLLH